MTKVLILYCPSVYTYAHSIVNHLKETLQSKHVTTEVLDITDVILNNINISLLTGADAILFGCPTSMSGPSSDFRRFMENTNEIYLFQGLKNKFAAGFTFGDSTSGDKHSTLQSLCNFASQHSMIWIPLGYVELNEGSSVETNINKNNSYLGQVVQMQRNVNGVYDRNITKKDGKIADYFGKRIATIVKRMSE